MAISTVYLLDDEEDLVELHCEVAKLAGFDVHGFTRANQFFEEVTEFGPGAIMILDLQMPEMDGIEVMRRLAHVDERPALQVPGGELLTHLPPPALRWSLLGANPASSSRPATRSPSVSPPEEARATVVEAALP